MGLFTTPRFKPATNAANRTQDSVSATFRRNVSSVDIAALKSSVETGFSGVAFNYVGNEFDYEVTLEGSTAQYQKAHNYLFPKGRDDITIEPFETLP